MKWEISGSLTQHCCGSQLPSPRANMYHFAGRQNHAGNVRTSSLIRLRTISITVVRFRDLVARVQPRIAFIYISLKRLWSCLRVIGNRENLHGLVVWWDYMDPDFYLALGFQLYTSSLSCHFPSIISILHPLGLLNILGNAEGILMIALFPNYFKLGPSELDSWSKLLIRDFEHS